MAEIIVSVADYRDITCDLVTSDTTVSARLDEAVDMIGEELDRWLPLDTYVEEMRVVNGHVYPRGVPVQSVISPSASAEIEMAGHAISLWAQVLDPVIGWPIVSNVFPEFEYVGGYTHAGLPTTLRRAIADLAWHLVRASPAALSTVGAGSVSVGDVSVSYKTSTGTAQLDAYVPGLSRRLSRYHRRLGQVSA